MGRRPRATWPGKERQEHYQPKGKTEVSAWLRGRLDALNRASAGGWFQELLRETKEETKARGETAAWWDRVYLRGAELFGEDFKGIRSVTVVYSGTGDDGRWLLKWRARRPNDGDYL